MPKHISRVQFLRGDFSGKAIPIRPPWSKQESLFTEACTRCGECTKVCDSGILTIGQGSFPEVNFSKGECTFCEACVEACKENVFESTQLPAWHYKATVQENCLAHQGIVCMVCAEQCETRAIRFTPEAGRVSQPQITIAACNGCGACYKPCPASAIHFEINNQHFNEQPNQNLEAYS